MINIKNHINNGRKQGQKFFAWLIDPDKMPSNEFERNLRIANESAIDFIFLGGSLLVDDTITNYITSIRKFFDKPIIIFPGSINQVNSNADGILLLSLISGRNPDFLIGRHVEVAAILKKSGLQVLPTGYILIDSGVPTTASYISNTFPIPHHKDDIATSTAMAGEMLGLQYIFLDAGSGAIMPVSESMIRKVRRNVDVPIIVGGGIRTEDQMIKAYAAGADVVVVGNIIEKEIELVHKFAKTKEEFISAG